jgi:uncharacterized membrane protein YidH (DUF202 family)
MNEQEILAVIRTLLALERNYLAVERTQLAQLRTGLTLALIGPPATAAFAYVYIFVPEAFYLDWIAFGFFIILTIAGIWMSYRAYVGLKVTRKMQKKIKMRELEVSGKSEAISVVLHDIIGQEKE